MFRSPGGQMQSAWAQSFLDLEEAREWSYDVADGLSALLKTIVWVQLWEGQEVAETVTSVPERI